MKFISDVKKMLKKNIKHKIPAFLCLLFATLFLSGCKTMLFDPQGTIAAQEMKLFITAVALMLIVVVPVLIAIPVIARRYRASNTEAKYTPEFTHSTKLEIIWWAVPIIIIAILAVITWDTTHKLDPYRPLDVKRNGQVVEPITIQAISLEWKWLFIYPKQGIATVNYVQFPVDQPIQFLVTSDAPMNSFQIQQLAGQIYSMNGMQTKLHMMADKIGEYRGRSVSFSGDGFSGMRFVTKVTSENDFNQWVESVKASPNQLTNAEYKKLVVPSENHRPEYFSSVTPGLFKKVIMSFMMPPKGEAMPKNTGPEVHL
ncbi:ubiquinol oxidase subunit II [Piscirickettsia salmonis]|uniref:ubiquinol oxidase subunit II n=1 Tax=Piscirickettsia salmonis TaxID=1238 RepID=UPI0007D84391|nr:Cytochrome bo(3) ubiquinol oxidase subunit 2 precursor [Piscirickettsiaceae bacterium NZ-RLO1]